MRLAVYVNLKDAAILDLGAAVNSMGFNLLLGPMSAAMVSYRNPTVDANE
jgi:hypothetical protein